MNELWKSLAQAPPTVSFELTSGGWVIMILSVGFVTGLLGWCIWRVTRESTPQKVKDPFTVDTKDTEE